MTRDDTSERPDATTPARRMGRSGATRTSNAGDGTGDTPPPSGGSDGESTTAVTAPRDDASLEAACTRVCRIATRLLDAEAAATLLIDGGRPYLVGAVGLDGAAADWRSSPLALSLAGHSGAAGEPLSIPDVAGHELLATDPLHRDFGFRAFLALPVRVGEECLGTVCALSRSARSWSAGDTDALSDLAESVVTEVRLRGSFRQIRAAETASSDAVRRSFASLVDDLDAVVNERELSSGAFTFVSRRGEDLLGYPVERWLDEEGFWLDTVVHPADRERVEETLAGPAPGGRGHDLQYRALTAGGETVWLRDLIRVVTDAEGHARFLRGVMVDVTEQRRTERALRLLQELAMVANEAEELDEPLELALERLCEHTEWPVGHVYRAGGGGFESSGIWHLAHPSRFEPFVEASRERVFGPGDGLPGRVAEAGRPRWIPDLRYDEAFVRAEGAERAGLRAAFAFPVLSGKRTVAVCELFADHPVEPDSNLGELARHVGTILGQIADRAEAAEELRRAELRARRTVETAHEAFISMGEDGRITEWNAEAEKTFGWSREEAVGRPLAELIVPPRHRDAHREGLERYLRTGEGPILGRRFEIDAVRKDGSEVPVELSITPLDLGDRTVFNSFLRDISERRRQDEERIRRERQLAQAQKLAHLGSWEWDMAGDRISWSDELHAIFGTDPDEFQPTLESYMALIHPEDRDLAESVIGAAAETHEDFMFEHRVVREDGSQVRVLSQGRVEMDPDGRPLRMAGTAQDITERKELEEKERALAAEQAAREEAEAAEERITEILESITDAFFTLDEGWRFTYVNSEAEDLLQRDAEEILGEVVWDAFPEARGSVFDEKYHEARRTGRRVEFEAHYGPLGRWFEVRAYPSEQGLSVYFHDITHRREAEARLRASEARYRFLADSIPQQVWTARPDGTLDYLNEVGGEYFGRPVQELLEEGWEALVHPDDLGEAAAAWDRALRAGDPYQTEFRLRDAKGAYRWHLTRALPQRSDEGEIVRWFGTNTDVHEQKELEQDRDRAMDELERVTHVLSSERAHLEEQARELRKYARALKRSNEELDQFAYVASHDLKAPLRGIANLTEWLVEDLSDSLTETTREYTDLLQNRVHRMEALIDGILEYSRAGRATHEVEEVDVGAVIAEVVDMIDPPESFEVTVEGWMPTLKAERTPLQQVLLNLVGNAVKHADVDDPRVRIALTDEGEEFLEFSVADNGPGIDPEYHDKIWTIFQTLRPRDEVEGTGIGLSVVKRTVEGQGGQVWVESRPGEGAVFRFLWPRTPPERSDTLGR